MTEPWTEAMLRQFNLELEQAEFPPWRREFREEMRRQNCPTFSELRADLRAHARLCTKPLKLARTVPGHLTPSGVQSMLRMLRDKRAEHSGLIRAEREAELREQAP